MAAAEAPARMKTFQLLPVDRAGSVDMPAASLPDVMAQNCQATASFYQVVGFEPPWIGYVSVADGRPVGGGAFKGPPREGRVEIAYYTLPELEGQGFASATARELIRIARGAVPAIVVTAQTLPTRNASTALLERLGFAFQGALQHPEDGEVWEWHLMAQPG